MRRFTNAQARYFHERLKEAHRAGYDEGYIDGVDVEEEQDPVRVGFIDQLLEAVDTGFTNGFQAGFDTGWDHAHQIRDDEAEVAYFFWGILR
jgi:hypothetical protein